MSVNHEAVLKYQQHDREGGVGSSRSRGWKEEKAHWDTNLIPTIFLTGMVFVGLLKDIMHMHNVVCGSC